MQFCCKATVLVCWVCWITQPRAARLQLISRAPLTAAVPITESEKAAMYYSKTVIWVTTALKSQSTVRETLNTHATPLKADLARAVCVRLLNPRGALLAQAKASRYHILLRLARCFIANLPVLGCSPKVLSLVTNATPHARSVLWGKLVYSVTLPR